jgi:DNA polymerase-3 subunit chi
MTEVWFYQLERRPLETALAELLEKTLARGWKAVVRCPDHARVETLDKALWTWRDDSFLPHGSGAEDAERQPIFLTDSREAPNEAQALFLIDGASADPAALSRYSRCVALFDGVDESALAKARTFWGAAKEAGCDVSYWKESPSGKWEKQT